MTDAIHAPRDRTAIAWKREEMHLARAWRAERPPLSFRAIGKLLNRSEQSVRDELGGGSK